MFFSLSHPCSILSIILLYNKEAALCVTCSLSTSVSQVGAIGADTALFMFAF